MYLLVHQRREKLQRVFNAAARVVSNRSKYDQGLTQFRFQTLHWLDVADRIRFRLCLQVHKSQHSMAPGYLADLCKPVSNINIYRDLRSAGRGQLDIPWVRLSTYGGCAFCYVGPSAWNDFLNPDTFKCNTLSLSSFSRQLTSEHVLQLTYYLNYLFTGFHGPSLNIYAFQQIFAVNLQIVTNCFSISCQMALLDYII